MPPAWGQMPVTILDLEDEDEDNKIRSRWSSGSCSAVTTLATSSPPSPTFTAAFARHRDCVLSTGPFPSIFGPIKGVARKPIHADPPPLFVNQSMTAEVLKTGIKVVDLFALTRTLSTLVEARLAFLGVPVSARQCDPGTYQQCREGT
ncbi:hypothetical protein V8E52_006532 [Russula decolorans]